MWDMNNVVHISYQQDYTFHIKFENGVEGNFDFSGYLDRGPIFIPLKDKRFFKQAFIEGGSIFLVKWSRYST